MIHCHEDGLVWTHRCQALRNGCDDLICAQVSGQSAHAMIAYTGRAYIRGGKHSYAGGPVARLYGEGAKRNIATFYQNIIEGRCDNSTVERAVAGSLTAILGREAAIRGGEITMQDLIKDAAALPFDNKGLAL